MKVSDVGAQVTSRSGPPGHESSVVVDDAQISTVQFDGFRLDVELDLVPFKKLDTRAKVLAERNFLCVHGDHDYIFATIVKDLVWQGKPFPGAERIGTNGIHIPNLGRFYFGEILIRASSRRLTMIRMELGSPTGGSASMTDVDTNGSWSL